jgi:hypothetical protein
MDETGPTSLLSCSHCHFAFHPKAASLTLDYCPRCLARRHVAQPLRRFGERLTEEPAASTWPVRPRLRARALDRGGVSVN